jgi:Ca-activated chloride channel family protein
MLPRSALSILVLALAVAPAGAAGLIIPVEPDLPPLALDRHDVRVEIDGQGSTTTVEQIFENHTERRLEAQYVFPIPKGAAMSRFTLEVGGENVKGELIRKDKARAIYESAVKRTGDASLLEYLGSDVFSANIFPIEPKARVKISVRFHQVLEGLATEAVGSDPKERGNLVHYVYPLRNGVKRGPTVHGEFTVTATIASATPIRNVYSPSHDIAVDRSREREVRVTYAEKQTTLMKDFHLYYSVSEQDVGVNLLTHRPVPGEPGYFLLLVSPRSRLQATKVVERDLVFVVDTSSSMLGEKMTQAKNALRHCVTNLNDGDRFGLVRFSTSVYPWNQSFVPATEGNRALATRWIDSLTAQGGTDMAGALETALAFQRDPSRPCYVVFLTDGRPTVGKTVNPKEILANVSKIASSDKETTLRLFSWGVGYDVDTQLLDGIASAAGGVSEYVRPEEDIALKVTEFYNKTSHPLLTSLKLEVADGSVRLLDRHPAALPDLYAGMQLVLVGRYTGEGQVRLHLSGSVNNESESFDYTTTFAKESDDREFVEILWARRRIGYLLDGVRQRGEDKEVVDEIVRLSMRYGVQTPYTSFIVLPDGSKVAAAPARQNRYKLEGDPQDNGLALGGGLRTRGSRGASLGRALDDLTVRATGRPVAAKKPQEELSRSISRSGLQPAADGESAEYEDREDKARRKRNDRARSLAEGFEKTAGKAAVETAKYLRKLKEAKSTGDSRDAAPFRRASGTRFFQYRGMWVDERFEEKDEVTIVKFASTAYFKLVAKHPNLVAALKISNSLVYRTAKGRALVIGTTGAETLTDEQIQQLFTPVK